MQGDGSQVLVLLKGAFSGSAIEPVTLIWTAPSYSRPRSAGHPGTGKSSVALALAQLLHWPLIDKDDSRDCFQGTEELALVPQAVLNELAYEVMFRTASKQLLAGNSAIVDCPLSKIGLYQAASAIAEKVSKIIIPLLT